MSTALLKLLTHILASQGQVCTHRTELVLPTRSTVLNACQQKRDSPAGLPDAAQAVPYICWNLSELDSSSLNINSLSEMSCNYANPGHIPNQQHYSCGKDGHGAHCNVTSLAEFSSVKNPETFVNTKALLIPFGGGKVHLIGRVDPQFHLATRVHKLNVLLSQER